MRSGSRSRSVSIACRRCSHNGSGLYPQARWHPQQACDLLVTEPKVAVLPCLHPDLPQAVAHPQRIAGVAQVVEQRTADGGHHVARWKVASEWLLPSLSPGLGRTTSMFAVCTG